MMVMTLGLAGCALHNNEQKDSALSSTEEVAQKFDLSKKYAKKSTETKDEYEFHRRANFSSKVKGIYISQRTLENREYLQYLIKRSKAAGINTFVIDLNSVSNKYEKNIILVRNSGIRYVARIVVFPFGGNAEKVRSEAYWLNRYRLVDSAIKLGADEIQLDYIRYAENKSPAETNTADIHRVIDWFKEKIGVRAKLQIDMIGESSFIPSPSTGQDVLAFASSIDACCPMLYPSHFESNQDHAKKPYDIIYTALTKLKAQFSGSAPFQVYPYIELANYRHSFSDEQLSGYIHGQIAAVEDANADGWYAWSTGNKYDRLFSILQEA